MISMQGGHFVPVPFPDLIDPITGRARVRMVQIESTSYRIARRYMVRLRRDDFQDPQELARLATTAGVSLERFREEFETLVEHEPPPIELPGVLMREPPLTQLPT